MKQVLASMAGIVKQVLAPVGTAVEAGQDVLLLESMKMEIAIPSELAGTVAVVRVSEGDFVNEGDLLLLVCSPGWCVGLAIARDVRAARLAGRA